MSPKLRTIAILRGLDPGRTSAIAQQAWAAGFDLVEVPVQDPAGWESLRALSDLAGRGALGVGTVLEVDEVKRAADLGCSVIISPGLDPRVVEATLDAYLTPLPGVFSPSEVTLARSLGVDTVKLFPAGTGGVEHLRALLGPFPRMRFIAVGGITRASAADYLRAGASGVAFGSNVLELLEGDDADRRVEALHQLVSGAERHVSS